MRDVVRIGILGFAHGHVDLYCSRWREEPGMGVRVVAGWESDAARAEKARERHGLELCASAETLVKRADVDGVVIAAETSMHAELVELAAGAGKAIVVQKPLALTLVEADRIVEAVDKGGVPFTLAWQMRVDLQNMEMKSLVQSGVLGKIFMVRRRHGLPTHIWPAFDKTWHVDPAKNRDIWADDAAHPVDFIYWMFGMPASVTAELGSLLNPRIPNDNGIAVFRYKDGMFAEVVCSFVCVAAENTTEIVGEKGTIIQNYGDVPSVSVPRPDGAVGLKWYLHETKRWHESEIASPKSQGERLAGLAGPLAEFFRGDRSPIATAREGRDVLRLVLACYDSAARGTRVNL